MSGSGDGCAARTTRSHLGREQVPVDKARDKMTEIFVSGQLFGGVGMGSLEKPHRWTAGKHSFLRCDELEGQKLRH